ncbi:polymorphic toxin-type HINT domain-containing protein [Pseudomonas japonica]|uniref:polymorphic toxin-type HINT domain-containing protein n=1 Tax=Pseudomonas japonica TaxID=256466 RepID=UPI00381C497E
MRLSRFRITLTLALLMAMIMGGSALAQRYDSYYGQQQMQRQQQMQQQQQQQQIQMQRQQEQMRRQQDQARQQQAAIRQQQAEQQRIMRARQQEAQRTMQLRRDQAMQQRQLALDRQRQASSQRAESEFRKAAKDQVFAKQQAVDRSALKQQGLEKSRQERLLRLKQDFLQKQRVTSGKASIPQPVRVLTLSEKFKASSGAKNIAAYQPGKQFKTKELATQRQAAQASAKKIQDSLRKKFNAAQQQKKITTAFNQASKNFQRCDLAGKCTCSFHGDTQVLTREGSRAIKSLVAGQDYVWSRNEYTGDMDWKPVTAHYSNMYDESVEVTVHNPASGETQTIISNRIHPFYVNNHGVEENRSTRHEKAGTNATGRWVEAQYLKAGDFLLTSSGTIVEVLGASVKKASLTAYNLSVSDYRTYFVSGIGSSKSSVWVHNECHDSSAAGSITRASVSEKLDRYLLNKDHPVGGSKAKWFDQALGFNKGNAADLSRQIVFDEKKSVKTALTQYGQKFNQIIPIKGANGRVIDVKFSWIRNTDGVVRLVTAIPAKK